MDYYADAQLPGKDTQSQFDEWAVRNMGEHRERISKYIKTKLGEEVLYYFGKFLSLAHHLDEDDGIKLVKRLGLDEMDLLALGEQEDEYAYCLHQQIEKAKESEEVDSEIY